jgi:hypothetical protein
MRISAVATLRRMSRFRLRYSLRRLAVVIVFIAGLLPAVAATAASAGTCVSWTGVQPTSPNSSKSFLASVTIVSRCNVWAVGSQQISGTEFALIEHWNGSAWKEVLSPPAGASSQLWSVHAVSAHDIWAVGTFNNGSSARSLVLRWNGTIWRKVSSPNPANATDIVLRGVDPVSANQAWAVGSYKVGSGVKTLTIRWNGRGWKQVASPSPGGSALLAAVTATSSSNAWAVGDVAGITNNKTLILHWNGRVWKHVASPSPGLDNHLQAVAASTGTNVWAVGSASRTNSLLTLTLRWNGRRWIRVSSPNPEGTGDSSINELLGLTAISSKDVWAVGGGSSPQHMSFQPLTLHWNGSRWARVASPNLGGDSALVAVSARSGSDLWAVGSFSDSAGMHPQAFHCC